MITSMIEKVFY